MSGHMVEIRKNKISGFTLIEITLAIFLLAVSLVTILGLQSSVVQRSINDSNELQAMLIARRILASIESGETPATVQDRTARASTFLHSDDEQHDDKIDESLEVQLKIEEWTIEAFPQALVNRVLVRVFWGEDPSQSLSIYYFIPANETFEPNDEEDDSEDGA